MNPETSLCWHPFKDGLTALRQACLLDKVVAPHWGRVENCAGLGFPDLDWAWAHRAGHIELKYRAVPPVRDITPVTVESVTPHQRLWWRQRWEAGGSVFVLLRLGERYFLFEGGWAAVNLGNTPMSGLVEHATLMLARSDVVTAQGAALVLEAACRRH